MPPALLLSEGMTVAMLLLAAVTACLLLGEARVHCRC